MEYDSMPSTQSCINTTNSDLFFGLSTSQKIIMFCVSIGACMLNGIVLYIVPKLCGKMKSSTRYAMLNLAITDGLLGFFSLLGRITFINDPQNYHSSVICKLEGVACAFLAGVAIFCISMMNIHRFIKMLLPVGARPLLNGQTSVILLFLIWLFSVVCEVSAIAGQPLYATYLNDSFVCLYDYSNHFALRELNFSIITLCLFLSAIVAAAGLCKIIKAKLLDKCTQVSYNMKTRKESLGQC